MAGVVEGSGVSGVVVEVRLLLGLDLEDALHVVFVRHFARLATQCDHPLRSTHHTPHRDITINHAPID